MARSNNIIDEAVRKLVMDENNGVDKRAQSMSARDVIKEALASTKRFFSAVGGAFSAAAKRASEGVKEPEENKPLDNVNSDASEPEQGTDPVSLPREGDESASDIVEEEQPSESENKE